MEDQVGDWSTERARTSNDLSTDETHLVTANHVRRTAISILAERRFEELSELASALAASAERPIDEDEVRIDLHHNHLPKLDAAGFVEYDHQVKLVEVTERGEHLASELGD